ncbi:CNOT6L [Cordylochernes scorpioides]|uniref:CNOT6L n=1 Tax=Cordylochernes scorpioides TaxID=51811 RepID=A0ABY6LEU0_9ARAC|nr:CNOT6L [Cordylochernes scorpioides]
MTQKLSRWVPHEHEKKSFLHRIVTSDDKWIHFSNPTRQKSWGLPGQFPKQTPRPNHFGKRQCFAYAGHSGTAFMPWLPGVQNSRNAPPVQSRVTPHRHVWHKAGLALVFCLLQFLAMTWYSLSYIPYASGVNPGGALNIRQHQTTLTRFRTGHLKPLKIENNNKIYPTCPKCSLVPAAPEHILACIRCIKQDLWERPLLIIKQLEEHELMEFV